MEQTTQISPKTQKIMAFTSLGLGIPSLICWMIPACGGPLALPGLVLGVLALKSPSRNFALVGVVLNSLGLCATIVNSIWGAYLGARGEHPLLRSFHAPRVEQAPARNDL